MHAYEVPGMIYRYQVPGSLLAIPPAALGEASVCLSVFRESPMRLLARPTRPCPPSCRRAASLTSWYLLYISVYLYSYAFWPLYLLKWTGVLWRSTTTVTRKPSRNRERGVLFQVVGSTSTSYEHYCSLLLRHRHVVTFTRPVARIIVRSPCGELLAVLRVWVRRSRTPTCGWLQRPALVAVRSRWIPLSTVD